MLLILVPLAAGGLIWLLYKRYWLNMAIALAAGAAELYLALDIAAGMGCAGFAFAPYGFELAFNVDGVTRLYLLIAVGMSVVLAVYTAGMYKAGKARGAGAAGAGAARTRGGLRGTRPAGDGLVGNCGAADGAGLVEARGAADGESAEGSCGAADARTAGGAYQFCLWASFSMIFGALLSDHLALTLFFWEGLLCTLFAMLLLRNRENPKTAIKALTVSGTADLLLMIGIAITISLAGTGRISAMSAIPIEGLGAAGFGCLMAGALGKAGCMPFHSWIPDAAMDAPTPFLAAFPGALEKLAGIYLASRAITRLYAFEPGGTASIIIMIFGAVTLFGGVCMALIQKDMKKLLSYHAISQVGYIVLGLGSGLAVGVAGGVYHLINNVLYKAGLFMAAGAVEKSAGTTDLHFIGGLRKKMPVTCVCTLIFALCIAGFPMTNGFTSKELIFDAALEIHPVFYAVALAGAFMTAASFLKLTRAGFFGNEMAPKKDVGEASASILIPMALLALACLLCAIFPALPLDAGIASAYGYMNADGAVMSFASLPKNLVLVGASCLILALAAADHIYGSKKTGGALTAADHIHYLPGVRQAYEFASAGKLDPYGWLMWLANAFGSACVILEKGVSWLYDKWLPKASKSAGGVLSHADNGALPRYLIFALCGLVFVGLIFSLA